MRWTKWQSSLLNSSSGACCDCYYMPVTCAVSQWPSCIDLLIWQISKFYVFLGSPFTKCNVVFTSAVVEIIISPSFLALPAFFNTFSANKSRILAYLLLWIFHISPILISMESPILHCKSKYYTLELCLHKIHFNT